MTMYVLTINCVDGVSVFETRSHLKSDLLDFLKQHDHEGSSLRMKVIYEDSEEIYEILD